MGRCRVFHLRGEAVWRTAGSPRPHFLTIFGLVQLYAAACCGASELNAGSTRSLLWEVESNRQQRRSPVCRRRPLRHDLGLKVIQEDVAEDRPWQDRDPPDGSVLGQAGAGNLRL